MGEGYVLCVCVVGSLSDLISCMSLSALSHLAAGIIHKYVHAALRLFFAAAAAAAAAAETSDRGKWDQHHLGGKCLVWFCCLVLVVSDCTLWPDYKYDTCRGQDLKRGRLLHMYSNIKCCCA
jgi:purine-cytosine permease-like protein